MGTWLHEPVDTSADPGIGAERGEALKLAVLLLLEKLSPTERAAYALREAFDYAYNQIASILQMEEANVRQLVSRARKHIADGRRASVGSNEQRRFLEAFIAAAQKADMAALEGLFAEDVASCLDGGELVRAAGVQLPGRKPVATFIAAVTDRQPFSCRVKVFPLRLRLLMPPSNWVEAHELSETGVPTTELTGTHISTDVWLASLY